MPKANKFFAFPPLPGTFLEKLARSLYYYLPCSTETKWKIVELLRNVPACLKRRGNTLRTSGKLPPAAPTNSEGDVGVFPTVSIIIPCYNQGQYLWDAISSGLASYSGPLEILVIDDGSTDPVTNKNIEEIKSYFPHVHVIQQQNQGLAAARNIGVASSSGKFIQFLDADDLLAPGKIDAQLAAFQNTPSQDVFLTNFLLCDHRCSTFSKPLETVAGYDYSLRDFLFSWERGLTIPIHCALFRRHLFDEVSFDCELTSKEDWLFWCSLAAKGCSIAYLDVHAAIYRKHDRAMTSCFFVTASKNWLLAMHKINRFAGEKFPDFIDASIDWLNTFYRSHPWYKKELALLKADRMVAKDEKTGEVKTVTTAASMTEEWLSAYLTAPAFTGHPLISVIIPVFNHYEYLQQCLESLLRQGQVTIELICVNDSSTDPRVHLLLSELQHKSKNITIITHQQNQGISSSQNEAVQAARGEFVAFLDCDDFLADGALQEISVQIRQSPHIDYFFSDRRNVDEQGKKLFDAVYSNVMLSENIQEELLDRMIASHLKVIRRSKYLQVAGNAIDVSGVQDWDTALKIAETGQFRYVRKILYYHRLHKAAITSVNEVAQQKKTNCLRRRYIEKWLAPDTRRAARLEPIRSLLTAQKIEAIKALAEVAVFSFADLSRSSWFCPPEIKSAWTAGKICVLDARGPQHEQRETFIKDFNSYFDFILCDHAEVCASIIGSLWSPAILWTPMLLRPLAVTAANPCSSPERI